MNNEKQFSIFNIINARNIVFIAMFAVGILCIVMSGRNTASYLMLTGMETALAIMTGIALIVFSATSFTAAQLFLSTPGLTKLFSLFFVVIGMIVITFSIFSTLSLNYTKFVDSEAIRDDLADKIEKRRAEIIMEYNALVEIVSDADSPDVASWTMQNMERFLSLAEQQGSSWNNSMNTILNAGRLLIETEQQKRDNTVGSRQQSLDEILENIYIETIPRTFFAFMVGLNDMDKKYFFDFFMIATPAVFYDLLAPLAITVVLFLLGFRRKEQSAPVVDSPPATVPEEKKPAEPKPRREKPVEIKPDINELIIYIDSALQDFIILPDDALGNIEERQCKKFRKYLMSYSYRGKSIISEKDGQFISIFDKTNLKRFIELLYNVQRIGE